MLIMRRVTKGFRKVSALRTFMQHRRESDLFSINFSGNQSLLREVNPTNHAKDGVNYAHY